MSDCPNCSIVICTYRRAPILTRTLKHLLAEPSIGRIHEILVIDNANDQATGQLVNSYVNQAPIRRIVEPRAGVSFARNTGAENATGEVIIYLDDDCLISPKWLPAVESIFAADNDGKIGVLGGPISLLWDFPSPQWYDDRFCGYFSGMNYGSGVFQLTDASKWLGEGNSAYWKSKLLSAGGFSAKLGRNPTKLLSNEGNELRHRLEQQGGQSWYHSDMAVFHIVFEERAQSTDWVLRRSFWAGISDVAQATQDKSQKTGLLQNLRYLKYLISIGDLRYLRKGSYTTPETLERAVQARYRWGRLRAAFGYH